MVQLLTQSPRLQDEKAKELCLDKIATFLHVHVFFAKYQIQIIMGAERDTKFLTSGPVFDSCL